MRFLRYENKVSSFSRDTSTEQRSYRLFTHDIKKWRNWIQENHMGVPYVSAM